MSSAPATDSLGHVEEPGPSPPFIDSHCHLTYEGLFERAGAVLKNARRAGVQSIVTIATDLADAQRALALAREHPGVYVVCGIHPHQAAKAPAGWQDALPDLLRRDDVFAVGEIGLDYHYDFSDRRTQRQAYERQLAWAADLDMPAVIHCREAHGDALAVLSGFPTIRRVVFHCFTGTQAEAQELLDRGFWISLTGVVTFKRSDELRRVAAMIPADRLMLETDAPYLSPEPLRSVRPNEPAYLVHTAACVARARNIALTELSRLTVANTRRFFRLPGA